MADVHAGSWFGLPDFGITEAISGALGGRTAQGGSNLLPGGAPTTMLGNGQSLSGSPASASVLGLSSAPLNNTQSIPSVQGASTSSSSYSAPSGGGDSALTKLSKIAASGGLNGPQQDEYNRLLAAQNNSAEAQRAAELGRANTQYDYLASQLQNQLSGLDTQRTNATNEIDTGLSGIQNQVNLSRTNAQNNTDQQIQQAGSIAKSSQQQNRNVLRALGIINSSAAGELLSKPINEFGKQRAQLQQALVSRFNELDNTLDQATKEAANKKNEILSNYSQLYSNIQNDLRFNDRQRVDALNSINAAASQHLADIQSQVLNYQNQVNLQKQAFAQQMAQITGYNNPNIDYSGIYSSTLSNSGAGAPKTAAIYQDPLKKNTLSGN